MINNFITKTAAGLYCTEGDFYLDPKRSTGCALVSHAHGDHAVASKGSVYCTAPTASFMQYRHNRKTKADFRIVHYRIPFYINGIKITFFPAGHILGSAQILMEKDGDRYLYTGDFKTQSDPSCEAFEFVECDHLITETTFASPDYSHPDPIDEIESLFLQSKKVIVGAYSLGKAQRITQLITEHCNHVKVYIHPDLENYHKMYADHGFHLGDWLPFRRNDFDNDEYSAFIVPPSQFRSYYQANVLKVFATGWQRSYYRCDRVLRVSDHADWPGVLELVRRTNAKKVYTVHGNGTFLKDHLKESIEVQIIG